MKIKTAYLGPIFALLASFLLMFILFIYALSNIKKTELEVVTNNEREDLNLIEGFKLDNLAALSTSPVFIPTRQLPSATDDKPIEVANETATPNLIGIMHLDGFKKALLKVEGDPASHWLSTGESLKEWKIHSIFNNTIELESPHQGLIEITIQRNSKNPTQPREIIPPKVVNLDKVASTINADKLAKQAKNPKQTANPTGTGNTPPNAQQTVQNPDANTPVVDDKTGQAVNVSNQAQTSTPSPNAKNPKILAPQNK